MLNGLKDKHDQLRQLFTDMGRVIVAFSAGIDSTLVLKVALDTLGKENVLAGDRRQPVTGVQGVAER